MKVHLTERIVKVAEPPTGRETRVFDDEVIGFGFCVYASNAKAFFLRYCIAGRRRYLTIGSWPDWSVTAAREQAKQLKREIDSCFRSSRMSGGSRPASMNRSSNRTPRMAAAFSTNSSRGAFSCSRSTRDQ